MTEAAFLPAAGAVVRWRSWPWRWVSGAVLLAMLWWWAIGRWPVDGLQWQALSHLAPESELRHQVQARGVLRVSVRSYSRPSLPNAPLPAEPDVLDWAYAQWLGQALGVPVELADHTVVADIRLQGEVQERAAAASPEYSTSYGERWVQLVVLRSQRSRWERMFQPVWARGWAGLWSEQGIAVAPAFLPPTVCVGEGAYPTAALQARGLRPMVARSSIHAISNFLSGQCDALAESPAVVQRLLGQSSWRFYAPLGRAWEAKTSANYTRDPWLAHMQAQWLASTARQQALDNRTSTIALEASLLEDGAICH